MSDAALTKVTARDYLIEAQKIVGQLQDVDRRLLSCFILVQTAIDIADNGFGIDADANDFVSRGFGGEGIKCLENFERLVGAKPRSYTEPPLT